MALIERKTVLPDTQWLAGLTPDDPVLAAATIGATILSPEHAMTTPDLISRAHTHALKVAVWTVNTLKDTARFVDYGADALVTDYPNRLQHLRNPSHDHPP